jgi:uncharacterized membrane protein
VTIDGGRLTLTRPDQPAVTGKAALTMLAEGWARWDATMADGRKLSLALVTIECSDGMSDHRYPIGAEVRFEGEILKGCAAKTDELPKGG